MPTLSEAASKELLGRFGVPFPAEQVVANADGAVAAVTFRLVPITPVDAEEMIEDLALQRLLGEFRREPAVDRAALADVLLGLSSAAEQRDDLASADLNPLLIVDGRPLAVDALVELR